MTNSIKGTHLEDVGLINLPSGWDIVEIQDLLSSDRGISVGVMYPGEHDPKGIPLVKVGDLTSNSINIYPDFYITPEKHYEYRRTAFEGGELLVTLVGALGHCAVVPESMRGWNAARAIAVLRLKNSQDAEFIRFCLLSPPLNKLINVWANTSVQATINLKEIKKLPIPFPEIKERTNIVDFLSCLDRKISNLRQQNETLESIAQTLFKHWFVDFEFPNEDGKPYKSSGGAMVRSDLGDIPVGWAALSLGEISTNHSETHKFENKSEIIFVNTGDVLEGNFLHQNYSLVSTLPGQAKKRIKKHDILYSEIRPINRRFAYVNFSENLDNYVVSTKFMVIRSNDKILSRLLSLILTRNSMVQEFQITAESRSGTFPQITFESISRFPVVIPQITTQEKLMKVITPLLEKREFNTKQIQTLTHTRDRLLPKLMSGQLRIPE